MRDLSASSESISQLWTNRSDKSTRHSATVGGQKTQIQYQHTQEDMLVEKSWVARAAL